MAKIVEPPGGSPGSSSGSDGSSSKRDNDDDSVSEEGEHREYDNNKPPTSASPAASGTLAAATLQLNKQPSALQQLQQQRPRLTGNESSSSSSPIYTRDSNSSTSAHNNHRPGDPTSASSNVSTKSATRRLISLEEKLKFWLVSPLVAAAIDESKYKFSGNRMTVINLTKWESGDEYKCQAFNSMLESDPSLGGAPIGGGGVRQSGSTSNGIQLTMECKCNLVVVYFSASFSLLVLD